jgi:hypothetical protein
MVFRVEGPIRRILREGLFRSESRDIIVVDGKEFERVPPHREASWGEEEEEGGVTSFWLDFKRMSRNPTVFFVFIDEEEREHNYYIWGEDYNIVNIRLSEEELEAKDHNIGAWENQPKFRISYERVKDYAKGKWKWIVYIRELG